MRTAWQDNDENKSVTSPMSVVISAFSPVLDVRKTATPQLKTDLKCVNQLPQMLTSMLDPTTRKPRMLFTDRGPGFYHRGQGVITEDYDLARRQHGYGLWAGTNATSGPHAQPPDIADVLLHETTISWFRARIEKSAAMLKTPWEETPKQLAKRFRAAVRDVNATCDVEGLCSSFPKRLAALVNAKGDRLRSCLRRRKCFSSFQARPSS